MAMYPCLSLPPLSFPTVSGAVCSFDSQYAGLPLKSHSVAVVGTQSGSGTPSPSNPRALNGWSAITITANSVPTVISIGSTIYGGNYDAVSGVLTVTHKGVDLGSLIWTYQSQYSRFISNVISDISDVPNVRTMDIMCSCYQTIKDGRPLAQVPDYSIYNSGSSKQLSIHDSRYTDGTDLATALSGQYATYLIRPTQTIQLPPVRVETLGGVNNVFADTGDTEISYIKLG